MKDDFYYLWTTGHGLYVLLGLLFFGIFISPLMIVDGLMSDIFVECVFALILITGVFTVPCSLLFRFGMLILALSAVVTRILHKFNQTNLPIANVDNILAALTLVAFSYLLIRHFILDKTQLRYRIVAAVAVYLILGVLFARLYEIVYLTDPSAFSLNEKINPISLIYFSFATLLTIGYGDIVPVNIAARNLAILEGIIGQLYIVILISSLVSQFAAQKIKAAKEEGEC